MTKQNQVFPVVPKSAAKLIDGIDIHVGDTLVKAEKSVRNLGVYLDRHLDMKLQISKTISVCHFQLRHLSQINRFLPRVTKERVVNAMIV